ncbi:MAG: hypothetical protein HND40_11960 [Ignavibacteriota bacterium]|nr:MAG: hypothetical protein F9K42_06040 [Ignavibacterium sp.]MBL1153633.1 hypothetical protein [Ignavibacteriota bacterium]MCO6448235.1 hypothetical protein [Ignavibacterium album]MCZ2268019.1 hypothetical protein [Ignavibacteriales bacterium]MDX9711447.1 hypothetical protein [Ignavibacteriaceae bacterium]
MSNLMEEALFNSITSKNNKRKSKLIKAEDVQLTGSSKIHFEEDHAEGIKIVLTKDADNNIKEIKFICSCGQTKSIALDYSE